MDAFTLQRLRVLRSDDFGFLTKDVLVDAGFETGRIRRWVKSGALSELAPGIYALPGFLPSDELMMVAWAASIGGTVDGDAALWLWGVLAAVPTRLDVSVAVTASARLSRCPLDVVVHRPVAVTDQQSVERQGLRLSTVERALCRVATYERPIEILNRVRSAVRLAKTSPEALAGFLLEHRRLAGRPALARAVAAVDNFASVFEQLFAGFLEQRGIVGWVREHKVKIDGRSFYLDFAWPHLRVAIELDGKAFHSTDQQFEADRSRQNLIVLGGWTILRFTWMQLVEDPERVAREIKRAISSRIVQKRAISA